MALALATLAIVAVILMTASEEQEVSRAEAGGWLPCWMGGTCDKELYSSQKEEDEAVSRWQTEADGDAKAKADKLPSEEDKSRWERTADEDKQVEYNADLGAGGKVDQEIAKNNGMPLPKKDSRYEEDTANMVSEKQLQKRVRSSLMHAALDRVKSLSTQVHAIKSDVQGKGKRRADAALLDHTVGKGLLSHGPEKVAILAKYPNSQKQIKNIISQVQAAEQAKQQAQAAQAKAKQLQQQAADAQKQAAVQAQDAKTALSKAQSKEKAHKLANQDVDLSRNRLMYAQQKVVAAQRQAQIAKVTSVPNAKPAPVPNKAEQVKNEVKSTLGALTDLKAKEKSPKNQPPQKLSADEMARLVQEQYLESQRRYREAKERTATMQKVEDANAWIENV